MSAFDSPGLGLRFTDDQLKRAAMSPPGLGIPGGLSPAARPEPPKRMAGAAMEAALPLMRGAALLRAAWSGVQGGPLSPGTLDEARMRGWIK